MRRRRWWAIALALAWMVALFVGRSLRDSPPPRGEGEVLVTQFVSPVITRYERGVPQWSLKFERVVESPEERGIYLLETVSEGVWYRDGRPDLRFEAERGRWNQSTGDLELVGGVRFVGEDLRFDAASVHWSAADGRFVVPDRVAVELKGRRARADRLVVDVEGEIVTLEGNVELLGDDGYRALGERAVFHQKSNRLEMYGSPVELEFPPR